MEITRRQLLLATAAVALCPRLSLAATAGAFVLPPLPYPYEALEPTIDTETMKIHHDKHHQAYVDKLNEAVVKLPEPWKTADIEKLLTSLDQIPEAQRTAVRNNGGGHYNHSLFWKIMGPGRGTKPSDELARHIQKQFGSVDKLQTDMNKAGADRFGSGWSWLTMLPDGSLAVESSPNQDNPLMAGKYPVMGIDVWEHAYYLKYQNRRPEYLTNWWKVVDWQGVSARYAEGKKRFKA